MLCQPEISVRHDLPVLSWLVDVSTHLKIIAGFQVEIFDTPSRICVFEGAWDGRFDTLGFQDSANFFGSGLVIDKEGVTFITPAHTLESLYVLYDESTSSDGSVKVFVSNSLSFVVQYSCVHLRTDKKIQKKLSSIIKGFHDFDSVLYDYDGIKISRLVYCNFKLIGKDIQIMPKNEPPHFPDYGSYKTYLVDALNKLCENAAFSKRKKQYRLVTTVSNGYDSAACTALASLLGGQLALTVKTARNGMPDSGKGVAEALGLDCVEALRKNPGNDENFAEAQFIVGGSGGDCVLHVFGEHLAGSLLLTGFHGDKIWDLHTKPTPYLKRGDASGNGLNEFRLRRGFFNVPVPFIGGVRHPDLYAISHSSEMEPYVMGTKYDRPIPRRIVEEAGVPRDLFAYKKKAAGFNLMSGESGLSSTSRVDLEEFVAKRQGPISIVEWIHISLRDLLSAAWRVSNRGVSKTLRSNRVACTVMKGFRLLSIYLNKMYTKIWPLDNWDELLFIWALEKSGARYRTACNDRNARKEAPDHRSIR